MTIRTLLPVCAAGFVLGSCSTLQTQPEPTVRPALGSHAAPVFEDAAACREEIARPRRVLSDSGFDAAQLGILSWNMKKGERRSWRDDLVRMAHDKDLVLIQEASLDDELMSLLEPAAHWAFAPGYRSSRSQTGVMTLSTQPPLAQCNLQAVEPLLGTPKATAITQFALWNSADTLLVANIHAVNFSLGLAEFSRQIDDLRTVLSAHTGPIILSGDFNTWRQARIDIVDALLADVGLERVDFAADHRTRFLGLPLDHLFVRGLSLDAATTQPVRSSDHNPLTAAFSVSISATSYYAVEAKDNGDGQQVSL